MTQSTFPPPKKKVLFLMFAFPDMNSSFNMYTTIVEEFVKNGHEVIVLAPGKKTQINIENNIPVLRVKTLPLKNVAIFIKGISNLLLPIQFKNALKKFYADANFDLIIIPTPPITLGGLAKKLKRKYNSKVYLVLRDIFPQNAVDLGFMKKGGLIHKLFQKKEKLLYEIADHIGCMSQANIDYVRQHNPEVEQHKLHELKNFQKVYLGFGFDQEMLIEKYGLKNKFTIVFGGNMGKPQQLENVLQLAKDAEEMPDVVFLLLGEGVQMDKLEQTIKNNKISNILINRTVPKQEYQDLLSICDIGLISLHENFTIPNIPSKALDYFNVGLPVLASLDAATDFGQIITEHELGNWSLAGDSLSLFENLKLLINNKTQRLKMGENGRKYFNHNLTPELAYHTIIETTFHVAQN